MLNENNSFDINSICAVSDHVIATGADDSLIKLWDKRTLNNNSKPISGFIGHY